MNKLFQLSSAAIAVAVAAIYGLAPSAEAALSAEAMCGEDTSDSEYKVLCPDMTTLFGDPVRTLSFSAHFVIRATYDDAELLDTHLKDGMYLSQQAQADILSRSEEIWTKFIDEIKFDPPYKYSTKKYKTNIVVSDYGYLSGGTFDDGIPGAPHPYLQAHFDVTGDYGGLAHEFTHALQNMANGADWFEFGGWFSESHAEFMASQMTGYTGCSFSLLYTPQFHYGTTKNRYCNWQFWEYLAETEGFDAINKIWTSSINGPEFELNGSNQKIPRRCETLDGPFSTLMRIMDWTIEDLNDVFGRWAMANVGWDYKRMGKAFKEEYGNTPERSMEAGEWGRLTRLNLIEIGDSEPYYAPPDYIAPERWGYNLVQLFPETGASSITITFRGVIQNQSAREKSFGNFYNEPDRELSPDSGWRFGLVAIQADGKTRHSALMSGAKATLNFKTLPDDNQTYLVVLGAPTTLHQIRWDQPAYSIYRYPWRVQIDGAIPDGSQDRSAEIANLNIMGSFHTNGGGFVADTATVSETAYVGPQALVLDEAMVSDNAKIEGRSTIFGNAKVSESATVRGQARVGGEARVYGHAVIHDAAQIWGGVVHGYARIGALTLLEYDTEVYDNAVVASTNGVVPINGRGRIYGTAQVLGAVEFTSIESLSSGVWYGLIHEEFKGDPEWGADRTAAEDEVTMSLENVGWDDYRTDSGHRSEHHQGVLATCIDPTSSSAPSFSPSDSPSDSPSTLPSDAPSTSPSSSPSNLKSSSAPSFSPSDSPSDSPSTLPSDAPPTSPSSSPSDLNSSSAPSFLPSDSPSELPSELPSDAPSTSPSSSPSDLNSSSVPSFLPSDSPSDSPSTLPSDAPPTSPSSSPSDLNSSSAPSFLPSDSPSDSPSELPSDAPSTSPSSSPSDPNSSSAPRFSLSDSRSDSPSELPSDAPPTSPSSSPSDPNSSGALSFSHSDSLLLLLLLLFSATKLVVI